MLTEGETQGRSGQYTGDREAVGGRVYIDKKEVRQNGNVPNTYTHVHGEGGAGSKAGLYPLEVASGVLTV